MIQIFLSLLILSLSPSHRALAQGGRNLEQLTQRERLAYEEYIREESDIMLSNIYRRGPHLIYDCKAGHFACVSLISSQICEDRRSNDQSVNKLELSCAPLKRFESADECEKTQQNVIHRLVDKSFCWNLSRKTLYEY